MLNSCPPIIKILEMKLTMVHDSISVLVMKKLHNKGDFLCCLLQTLTKTDDAFMM